MATFMLGLYPIFIVAGVCFLGFGLFVHVYEIALGGAALIIMGLQFLYQLKVARKKTPRDESM